MQFPGHLELSQMFIFLIVIIIIKKGRYELMEPGPFPDGLSFTYRAAERHQAGPQAHSAWPPASPP